MMSMVTRFLTAILVALAAGAGEAAAPEIWPAGDREEVERIEAYLESTGYFGDGPTAAAQVSQ